MILVLIVAFLLAFVSTSLKDRQDKNVELDRKKQILYSLNIRGLDDAAAEAKYAEVVKEEKNHDGMLLYGCEVEGKNVEVVSLKGMGLWGGISGYLSLQTVNENTDSVYYTVYGAYFNHESETAGLGAEIKDSQKWQEQFIGKRVFANMDKYDVALAVVKKVTDPSCEVEAVTGATLTSDGVNNMIKEGLGEIGKLYKGAEKSVGPSAETAPQPQPGNTQEEPKKEE